MWWHFASELNDVRLRFVLVIAIVDSSKGDFAIRKGFGDAEFRVGARAELDRQSSTKSAQVTPSALNVDSRSAIEASRLLQL